MEQLVEARHDYKAGDPDKTHPQSEEPTAEDGPRKAQGCFQEGIRIDERNLQEKEPGELLSPTQTFLAHVALVQQLVVGDRQAKETQLVKVKDKRVEAFLIFFEQGVARDQFLENLSQLAAVVDGDKHAIVRRIEPVALKRHWVSNDVGRFASEDVSGDVEVLAHTDTDGA